MVVCANTAQEIPLPELAAGTTPENAALPPLQRLPVAPGGAPGTNLQAGLRLALTLFPESQLPRIVVATDGLETEGSLAAESETLQRFGVPVHWLDLGPIERPNELMVTKLEIPAGIEAKIPFKVTTRLKASRAMRAKCEVQLEGIVATTAEHDLPQRDPTLDHELRLKGERLIAKFVRFGRAPIHQENRDGPSTGRQTPFGALGVDGPNRCGNE